MESPNLQMSKSPGSYNLFGSEDPKQAPEEQKASEEEEDCPFLEEEDKEPSEESSEEPEKTQSPLDDDTNYLDQLEFFTLLQDFGIDTSVMVPASTTAFGSLCRSSLMIS